MQAQGTLFGIKNLASMTLLAALWVLPVTVANAQAQDTPPESPPQIDPDLERPPPLPPPLPPKIQDEQVEPTVVIREEEDRRIEEYSLDGKVYMVKVTPFKGPPFYYIDTDGDGTLELDERSRALNPVQPAYWKIKEWD